MSTILAWLVHRINKIVITAITDVVVERTEQLQRNGGSNVGDLPERVKALEATITRLDGEVRGLCAGHTTLIERQADIARQVGVARRDGD